MVIWKKNLGVGAKIFLPVVGGLILLIIIFVILISNLQKGKSEAVKDIASTKQAIYLFNQLAEEEKQNELLITTYRYQSSKGVLDTIQHADEAKASILKQVEGNITTEPGKELLRAYIQNNDGLIANRQRLIEAVGSGQSDQADQAFEKWKTQRRKIDAALSDIVVYSTSLLDRDVATFNLMITEVLVTYLLILLATTAMVITLYWYMRRLIVLPLKQLTLGAKRVTEQDLDWKTDVHSGDEIGRLSQAFNEMTAKLSDSYNRLKSLAYMDTLTGASNRQALEPKMRESMEAATARKRSMGVLLMDLDRLKKINDTLGHDIGDLVLKETAGRLRSVLRPEDEVIRLGGDEFVIILQGLESAHGAVIASEKILTAFEENMVLEGHELHVSGSLGVAVYPNDAETISGLLKAADIALYGAKSGGRNRYNLYNRITDMNPSDQLELERQLRAALRHDQLKVFFQPLVDIKTNEVVSVEALLRWQHPSLGMLLPREFIPLSEECGFIHEISQWALKVACQEAQKWGEKTLSSLRLAVNLSPRQLSENNVVHEIADVLKSVNFPPTSLTLEITESVALTNMEVSREKLKQLSQMGIEISIDDFGTGYSSLSSLRDFPVSKIKIDHSFIRHVITDPKDTAMVKAVITMGHNLNLIVAAEGVETDMQLALLKSLGCDEIQGYYFSRPLSSEDFRAWLEEYKKKSSTAQNNAAETTSPITESGEQTGNPQA